MRRSGVKLKQSHRHSTQHKANAAHSTVDLTSWDHQEEKRRAHRECNSLDSRFDKLGSSG